MRRALPQLRSCSPAAAPTRRRLFARVPDTTARAYADSSRAAIGVECAAEMGTENGSTARAATPANQSTNSDEITRGAPAKHRTKPAASKSKPASRPTKKKVRVPSSTPVPPAANGAPAVTDAPDVNGVRSRALSSPPRSMDEYRVGCLRLEKMRHEKMYESEKRRLYAERAIERAYEWDVRDADEAYAAGLKAVMMRLLADNALKTRRIEELRFGIIPAQEEDNYHYLVRRHEMSLRNRNSTAFVDEDGNLLDDDHARALRRVRKAESRANAAAMSRSNARNGYPKNDDHTQPKVKLHLALDDAAVASDLAKIKGGKRTRDADGDARRVKKRK